MCGTFPLVFYEQQQHEPFLFNYPPNTAQSFLQAYQRLIETIIKSVCSQTLM